MKKLSIITISLLAAWAFVFIAKPVFTHASEINGILSPDSHYNTTGNSNGTTTNLTVVSTTTAISGQVTNGNIPPSAPNASTSTDALGSTANTSQSHSSRSHSSSGSRASYVTKTLTTAHTESIPVRTSAVAIKTVMTSLDSIAANVGNPTLSQATSSGEYPSQVTANAYASTSNSGWSVTAITWIVIIVLLIIAGISWLLYKN